jgi:hypothetical protein
MTEKIELKEKLAAVDINAKSLWNDLSDDQKKALKNELYILNRYVSNVKSSSRDEQEHYVLTVNEYFNKHFTTLQKDPKLLWFLLCMCNYNGKKIFFHEWIGFKRKKSSNKFLKFLTEIYPDRKDDELELMSKIYTEKDCIELARDHGYSDQQIQKLFK